MHIVVTKEGDQCIMTISLFSVLRNQPIPFPSDDIFSKIDLEGIRLSLY